MPEERILIDYRLSLQRYTSDVNAAIRQASQLDSTLLRLVGTANDVEKALNGLKGNIAVKVDTGALDKVGADIRAIEGQSPRVSIQVDGADLSDARADVRAIDGATPDVTVDVDSSEVDSAKSEINALPSLHDLIVDAETSDVDKAENKIKGLPRAWNLDVDADTSMVDRAESKIDSLPGRHRVDVTANTGDLDKIERRLNELKGLAKIQIGFDIASAAMENFEGVPILGAVAEMDTAIGLLTARTGIAASEAESLIRNAYVNAFGESRVAVAEQIAMVGQLESAQGDLEGATIAAMTTADVTGEEFNRVLMAMDRLVSTGLSDNFQSAADVIVGGFQNGTNRGEDFIDTIIEYSSQLEQGNMSMGTFMSLANQALDAGSFNVDKVADTFKEFNLKIAEALGDTEGTGGTARPILEQFGLMDEADLVLYGEMSAAEFMDAFFETADEMMQDPENHLSLGELQFAMTELFGTPVEDLGYEIFRNLDFSEVPDGTFDGLAEEAGTAFYDNISTKITELKRVLEEEFIASLKAAGIDFGAMLDTAKEKISEIAALLREGEGLPEALEIALEAPGLADTIHRFEAVAGNLVIEFLSGVANILQGLGNMEGATSVRGTVADLAGRQLAFDIQLAETETQMADAVQRAIDRGAEAAIVEGALTTAVTEMVGDGAVDGAQRLLDTIGTLPPLEVEIISTEGGLFGESVHTSVPIRIDGEMTQANIDAAVQEAVQEYQAANPDAQVLTTRLEYNPDIDTGFIQGDLTTAVRDEIVGVWQDADASVQEIESAIDLAERYHMDDAVDALQVKLDEVNAAFEESSTESSASVIELGEDVYTSTEGMNENLNTTALSFEEMKERGIAANTDLAGNFTALVDHYALEMARLDTVISGGGFGAPAVPGGQEPAIQNNAAGGFNNAGTWSMVGEAGRELVLFGQDATVLNNRTTESLMSMLGGLGGGTTNYITVNQNLNVGNNAQASVASDRLSRHLRGF